MSKGPSDRAVLAMFVVSLVGLLAVMVFAATRPSPPPPPCSTYANWTAQSVPARCLKNFDGDKQ